MVDANSQKRKHTADIAFSINPGIKKTRFFTLLKANICAQFVTFSQKCTVRLGSNTISLCIRPRLY